LRIHALGMDSQPALLSLSDDFPIFDAARKGDSQKT
jgi:hypothetical protein